MDEFEFNDTESVNKDVLLKKVKGHIIEMEQNEKILQTCHRKFLEFQNE